MSAPDRRLNAFRPDLADARLKGVVQAERFAEGRPAVVAAPVADVLSAPRGDSGLDTQLLAGDEVAVFDESEGWSWVQAARDGYVGYVRSTDLGPAGRQPTHRVAVPRTFAYLADDMKSPRRTALSLGSMLVATGASERRGTSYVRIGDDGHVVAQHLRPVDGEPDADYVSVAETLERTPYLWGGASAFGLDCSGLVQLSMRMAGIAVPRDTDMQQRSVGTEIDPAEGLRRGDLVFWKGHVAIMLDAENIIHANGHTMSVAREPLAAAMERIAIPDVQEDGIDFLSARDAGLGG